jgi:hypothetical protein
VDGVEVKVTTAEPLHAAKNAIAAASHGAMIQRLERRDAKFKPKLRATIDPAPWCLHGIVQGFAAQ